MCLGGREAWCSHPSSNIISPSGELSPWCRTAPSSPFPPLLSGRIHSKMHTETIKPHKCPHCSKTFANTSYLAQHLRIHSGAKPYNCSYCQKAFRQLSHLQQHTR